MKAIALQNTRAKNGDEVAAAGSTLREHGDFVLCINNSWEAAPAKLGFSSIPVKLENTMCHKKGEANGLPLFCAVFNYSLVGLRFCLGRIFAVAIEPIVKDTLPKYRVLCAQNPMAFFREVKESGRNAFDLSGREGFHPLGDGHAEIFFTVDHQEWCFPFANKTMRREVVVSLLDLFVA